MAINISECKTGLRWRLPDWYTQKGEVAVEFACPRCFYVWLEYSSSEQYPDFCPGCGSDLIPDEEEICHD